MAALFSFLKLRGWDQIPRSGLTILNHHCADDNDKENSELHRPCPSPSSLNLALNQVC